MDSVRMAPEETSEWCMDMAPVGREAREKRLHHGEAEMTETLTVERFGELEEIARKATRGEWTGRKAMVYADDGFAVASANWSRKERENNAAHIRTFDPPTTLSLLALARDGLVGRNEIERLTDKVCETHDDLDEAEAELAAAQMEIELAKAIICDAKEDRDSHRKRAEAAEARVRGLEEALRNLLPWVDRSSWFGSEIDTYRQRIDDARAALTPPTEPGAFEEKHNG